MKFDKSIKEGKLPFSCIDCIKAEEFLDKEGYFTDNISMFTKPNFKENTFKDKLYDIDNSNDIVSSFQSTDGTFYKYFLPKEWVKEKEEKKYRPYTLAEWIEQHEIGEVIHYRSKSEEVELRHMYVGTRHSQGIKKKNHRENHSWWCKPHF